MNEILEKSVFFETPSARTAPHIPVTTIETTVMAGMPPIFSEMPIPMAVVSFIFFLHLPHRLYGFPFLLKRYLRKIQGKYAEKS